jgi:hypothetical protein
MNNAAPSGVGRALAYCSCMIFSENRYPLFRIMRYSAATLSWLR